MTLLEQVNLVWYIRQQTGPSRGYICKKAKLENLGRASWWPVKNWRGYVPESTTVCERYWPTKTG